MEEKTIDIRIILDNNNDPGHYPVHMVVDDKTGVPLTGIQAVSIRLDTSLKIVATLEFINPKIETVVK